MMHDRGGLTLKTGDIGKMNVLRQQVLLPGEVINTSIKGSVKLESLRERDSLRIHAHIAAFLTPIRWLWSDWPTYLREGPEGNLSIPMTATQNLHRFGIGAHSGEGATNVPSYFVEAPARIYNEWYKWPEDPDVSPSDGWPCVPLQKAWNRARYNATPSAMEDYIFDPSAALDVRQLAEVQARFRSAMERDVLSYNRYIELVQEMFNADGSREVDQVPMMVDQTDVGVDPRDVPAMDGASLGQWQSLFDFNVDHQIKGITAPEHSVLTYILVIRFAPIMEMRHPLASDFASWAENVGDPEILQAMPPQPVTRNQFVARTGTDVDLGYLPAGWQWRAGHDVIGQRIDERNSFPYMLAPTNPQNAKDASRIKDAFRSQSLGDYVVDLYFDEKSKSPISDALESYFSGMDGRGSSAEFPKQGKML